MIRRAVVGLALVALLAVPACSDPLGPAASDLTRAMLRWNGAQITTYEFTVVRSCFCYVRRLRVTVDHDSVVSVTDLDTNLAVDTTYLRDMLTVDRVFALIRRTIDSKPASLRADYDAQLGYPVTFSVDPDFQTADEEFGVTISELNVISSAAGFSAASRPGAGPQRRRR